jgi:hypothetical protein
MWPLTSGITRPVPVYVALRTADVSQILSLFLHQ